MFLRTCSVPFLALLVWGAAASEAAGQVRVLAAGAAHYDVHDFPEEEPPTRLDGSAIGLTVLGGVAFWHLPLRVELSQGRVHDHRQLRVEVEGATLTVHSTVEHRTRTIGLLTGYTHSVSSRIELTFLIGAAFSNVRRTFRTTAPRVVLVSPSTSNAAGVAVATDTFKTVTGGADVSIRIAGHVHMVVGARLQELRVLEELEGSSARSFVGLGWGF